MFLPTTKKDMEKLNWDKLDIIIVTGDTYIDSPYIGAVIIGGVLEAAGYKVGIIAQPDINEEKDITRLGEPSLFWGVTVGSLKKCLYPQICNNLKVSHKKQIEILQKIRQIKGIKRVFVASGI